jgi:hypothetical protein
MRSLLVPGFALVGVADNVFLIRFGVADKRPLHSGREAGAASAAEAGILMVWITAGRIGKRNL